MSLSETTCDTIMLLQEEIKQLELQMLRLKLLMGKKQDELDRLVAIKPSGVSQVPWRSVQATFEQLLPRFQETTFVTSDIVSAAIESFPEQAKKISTGAGMVLKRLRDRGLICAKKRGLFELNINRANFPDRR